MTGADRDGGDALAQVHELIAREPSMNGAEPGLTGWLQRLCRAARRALEAIGVDVRVMTDAGSHSVAAAFDDHARGLADLQLVLGEGPCHDAFAARRPVLVPDLAQGAARWPFYTDVARERGVQAVFAFPLQVGAARLGVVSVYRDRPGELLPAALAHALAFAETAVVALLRGQEQAGDALPGPGETLYGYAELHQAEGMVMVQLGISLAAAAARLRAHAFANDRRLDDVAREIVERSLTLERDAGGP